MKCIELPALCRSRRFRAVTGALAVLIQSSVLAQPDPHWLIHDRARPLPPVVNPGTFSSQEEPGRPPSDAIVLFDGSNLNRWCALDGSPTQWVVKDGAMECVPGSGYARTQQSFGDCQLHVEWATPTPPHGEGQGRGNSGVFFGLGRYEIQVLDSYQNKTYADGSASSVYNQYPPLVNASRPPGSWQVYDIIWTSPRFDGEHLLSPAFVTVLHNGVLVQNHVQLTGPTAWLTREPYDPHPPKLPIELQDHGNPVRFRNIWVRELSDADRPEFGLPDKVLDGYTGTYERAEGDFVRVRRANDGLLSVSFQGARFLMHAGSPTHFFATTTDVQCDFHGEGDRRAVTISVGEGPGFEARKVR